MSADVKKNNLIFQLDIDHSNTTSNRKSSSPLQTTAERMIIKRFPTFTSKEKLITLTKLFG